MKTLIEVDLMGSSKIGKNVLKKFPRDPRKSQCGMVYDMTVTPQRQGQGIATKLTANVMEWLQANCQQILAVGRLHKDVCNSQKVLTNAGLTPAAYIPDYWADEEYDCHTCELTPCKCSAIIFSNR